MKTHDQASFGDSFGLMLTAERPLDGTLLVRVAGELDIATAVKLEQDLEGLISGGEYSNVVLDLEDLSFIDSTGLRALWYVRQYLQGLNGTLSLRNPSPQVLRVLRMTKLSRVFSVDGDAPPA